MELRHLLRPGSGSGAMAQLEQRVADLEADMTELRRHNVRLAELADILQELLVPLASRDDEAIRAAVERFGKSL